MYQGIFGALLGSTLTLVVTHFLKNHGKISIYIRDYQACFFIQNPDGGGGFNVKATKLSDDANQGHITFQIELYNSAEVPKPLKEFVISFYDAENKLLFQSDPRDIKKVVRANDDGNVFKYINLLPKKLVQYELYLNLDKRNCSSFSKVKRVYLEYRSARGRKIRSIVKKY
jgi:hypothetical protein